MLLSRSIQTLNNETAYLKLVTNADIPDLTRVALDSSISLIDKFYLFYAIEETEGESSSSSNSVDNRTIKVEIIAPENVPVGYKMVFLLYSDWFTGKVDATRQLLAVSDLDLQTIQTLFRNKVASIIEEKIPRIKARNKETKSNLENVYPHLSGYFNSDQVGYVSRCRSH